MWVADVSNHNGENIADIIAHNDIVIVNVAEGVPGNGHVNEFWQSQAQQVLAAGKRLGLYHFSRGGDGDLMAKYFLQLIGNYATQPGVVLVFDEESTDYNQINGTEPLDFYNVIKQSTYKDTLLYMFFSEVQDWQYGWADVCDKMPLWLAGWPLNDGSAYSAELQAWGQENYFKPLKFWNAVTMWQYDTKPYDRSIFFGSPDDWDALGGKNLTEQSPQASTLSADDKLKAIQDILNK